MNELKNEEGGELLMKRQRIKKTKFRQLKRVGTMALAATIALSVPAVSNVVSKVGPVNHTIVSAAEDQTNLMNVNEILTNFNSNHNDDAGHWSHTFVNDGDMDVDGPEFDLTDLKYVIKFPEELSHLLDDEYVLDYLFGRVINFGSAQNSFSLSGYAIDETGEQITINKDTHKPYNHISINQATNSLEFDFTSFYTENNLTPYIRTSFGEYIFNNLGFSAPIVVPDSRMLYNGTYEFKSAIVRGESVDLDNVSNAHSENLVVDYSTDPDPEPEVNKSELGDLAEEAASYRSEDYTEESFGVLIAALADADVVLANENATQAEVDAALADLQTAIDGLEDAVVDPEPEPEEADKSELEAALAQLGEYQSEDYTEDSYLEFAAATQAALMVIENVEATQEEVDLALANLQAAVDGLVLLEEPTPEVDTSELEAAVAEADGFEEASYTEESYAILAAAMTTAEAVLSNAEATQEEVDRALADLQTAISGLVETETEIEEPRDEEEIITDDESDDRNEDAAIVDESDDSNEEVTVVDGADNSNEEVKVETEEGEGNKLPHTATSSFNIILGGFLLFLVGAGSLFLGRRKLN